MGNSDDSNISNDIQKKFEEEMEKYNAGVSYNVEKENEEELKLYTTISGRINENYIDQLNNYDISDPNSEKILEYCNWEDYRKNEAYENCIVKNSDYYSSVTTKYSFGDLKNAIIKFTSDEEYDWHLNKMEETYENMKSERLTTDEKKACALVLSYYTGYKDNSDRSSRNTNTLIRSSNQISKIRKWSDGESFYPIIYYLTKAISILPFYWGYTLRCVQLTKAQAFLYRPGTVITWLQWSSSKIGKSPADSFKERNIFNL